MLHGLRCSSAVASYILGSIQISPFLQAYFGTAHSSPKAIEALPFSPLGVSSRWELFLRLQCHRCCCWVGRYSFLPQGNSCASCRCCKGIDAAQEALPRLQAVSCWSLVEDRMTYIFNLTTTLFSC